MSDDSQDLLPEHEDNLDNETVINLEELPSEDSTGDEEESLIEPGSNDEYIVDMPDIAVPNGGISSPILAVVDDSSGAKPVLKPETGRVDAPGVNTDLEGKYSSPQTGRVDAPGVSTDLEGKYSSPAASYSSPENNRVETRDSLTGRPFDPLGVNQNLNRTTESGHSAIE